MNYIHPPRITAVPVSDSEQLFAINRVYCIGRNYADHAIEMGVDPRSDPPFFFCKPADTVIGAVGEHDVLEIPYPPGTENLHHEVELVVAIGQGGRDISREDAEKHIFGYAVGIDMTRRDLQQAMRKGGKPWEIGKTFELCAPVGVIQPIGRTGVIQNGGITLSVDDVPRQHSDISKLIWSVSDIIADLSALFTLYPGDLIFTGTPEGVGPVEPGQMMRASVSGVGTLQARVVA